MGELFTRSPSLYDFDSIHLRLLKFHLGCVGLEQPPGDEESWYCRDCQHLAKGAKTRRRKRR